MRLIGIDYGEKNVGLAVSDDQGLMAFPHSVMRNTSRLADEVEKLAKDKDASLVVIGESRDYKGNANSVLEKTLIFAEELRARGLTVELESETLSSHQAAHFQGKTDMIDAAAASIILQSYIDRKKPQVEGEEPFYNQE
ncbi:MAG: Holliday junction resolvase RuvX [bacterium]|nr:Holliday junction resolvase RuvX [bacterium]